MLFAVGRLDVGVFKHLDRALAPLVEVFLAQRVALGRFFGGQLALFFYARKLIYSLKL